MTWSLSRLHTYEGCAAKYKFAYVERLKSEAGPAADRGLVKHAIMEAAIRDPVCALPIDLAQYQGYIEDLRRSGAQAELKIGLDKNWKLIDYDHPDVSLRAVLDVMVRKPTEGVVLDWKTGKIYEDKHADGRELYAVTALSAYPELYQVRVVYVYIDLGKNRETTIHRDQAQAIREKFETRVARMESDKELIPNPTFMCRYCSFSRHNGGPCKF